MSTREAALEPKAPDAVADDTRVDRWPGLPLPLRLWKVFIAFARVGIFGFGGGPSMIPLIRNEVVKANGWISDEDFMELYAFASSLPGPIATNLAGHFGRSVAGTPGALAGLLGLTLPSGIAIVALGGLYAATKDSPLMQDALAGVRPVVIALLLGVAASFATTALRTPRGRGAVILRLTVVAAAFAVAAFTALHPAALIVMGAGIGLALRRTW